VAENHHFWWNPARATGGPRYRCLDALLTCLK
jgi:hypothetical protein